jgi:hypothetical protein
VRRGHHARRLRQPRAQDFSYATLQAVRDVFKAEIPHYFRHLFTGDESVAPRVEYAAGIEGDNPRCVVSIIGCTGDWFGGWDGLERGSVERFITEDLKGGRLVEVIDRGEPAIMVCHWPGIYFNGDEVGFNIFKEIVGRLKARYDNLVWMKNSEIARYWAARELTRITHEAKSIALKAPFACPGFTIQFSSEAKEPPRLESAGQTTMLTEVRRLVDLKPGTFARDGQKTTVCFDLPKGESRFNCNLT